MQLMPTLISRKLRNGKEGANCYTIGKSIGTTALVP